MKFANVKKRGAEYLLAQHGNAAVKIYSSERKIGSAKYQEHCVAFSQSGKRVRRRFSELADAKAEAERVLLAMANGATNALTLNNCQAEEYALAARELGAINAALLPAVREYRAAVELLDGKALLIEAVRFYMANGAIELVPKTVPEAVAELLNDKAQDRRSKVHLADLKYRLGKFAEKFTGQISHVEKSQITQWLRALDAAPRSRNNFANAIRILFRWSASDEKKYLPPGRPTAAENLPRADETDADGEDVVVYKTGEVRQIFERVSLSRPELIPFLSIAAFAGLRTAEIQRLDWSHVDFEQGHIEIKKGRAKTRSRRLVPISPNLAEWLAPFKGKTGSVCPYSRTQHVMQRQVERKSHDGAAAALKWKRNALRHSFGSYRLAIVKSEQQVAGEMGNSPTMLYQNYRGIVTEAQAKEYFSISREGV